MYNTLHDGTQYDTEELAIQAALTAANDLGEPQYIWKDATGGADYITVEPTKEKHDV